MGIFCWNGEQLAENGQELFHHPITVGPTDFLWSLHPYEVVGKRIHLRHMVYLLGSVTALSLTILF